MPQLADHLEEEGLTEREFGARIGRPQQAVNRLKRGAIPDRETMRRIAQETGGKVQPNDWFGLPGAPPEEVLAILEGRAA